MHVVYKATNLTNGKFYIGVTGSGLVRRRQQHWDEAQRGSIKKMFMRALRKYGKDGFEWIVLESHNDRAAAFAAEVRLIAQLKPQYNHTLGGEGALGAKRTPEQRAAMSTEATGRKMSAESIAKAVAARRASGGYVNTPERSAKLSASLMGRKVSAETRAKISAAHKGRKLSPEHVEKVAAAKRGLRQTPEQIERRVAHLRGKPLTDEHKKKLRLVNTGVKRTEDACARMSEAQRNRTDNRGRGNKRTPEFKQRQRDLALKYKDEWLARRHQGPSASAKPVICLDDGTQYPSASEAARAYGVARSALIELCLGQKGRKTVGKRKFTYVVPESNCAISA